MKEKQKKANLFFARLTTGILIGLVAGIVLAVGASINYEMTEGFNQRCNNLFGKDNWHTDTPTQEEINICVQNSFGKFGFGCGSMLVCRENAESLAKCNWYLCKVKQDGNANCTFYSKGVC